MDNVDSRAEDIESILFDATCNAVIVRLKGDCKGFQPNLEILAFAINSLIFLWGAKTKDCDNEEPDTKTFLRILSVVNKHLNYAYPEFLTTLVKEIMKSKQSNQ